MESSQGRAVLFLGKSPQAKRKVPPWELTALLLPCFFAHSQELPDWGTEGWPSCPSGGLALWHDLFPRAPCRISLKLEFC